MTTRILGISAYYHDSAAALIEDGRIVGAAQEERFTRVKGDSAFPHQAIGWCLDEAGVALDGVDHVVFYEQPLVKFERLLVTALTTAPRGLRGFLAAMPDWLTRKLWLEREIARELGLRRRVWFVDHHRSHAASAFYPSPFETAAILTIDGVGEWSTATWGVGRANRIELREELRFPNSLGLLYSAFTYYCGFKINSGEYKLMGLAPYGRPIYASLILEQVVHLRDDGAMLLNQKFFNYATGLTTTSDAFHELFEGPPRQPESPVTQRDMDLAASIQHVTNESLLRMGRHVQQQTSERQVVLAGGVALNCVATGLLASSQTFEQVWTQPAAGDAGGALGAALSFWHHELGQPRVVQQPDAMRGAFLGPSIPSHGDSDDALLRRLGAVWESLADVALQQRIADEIAAGRIVAVARGPMEFGPRALGGRSILGDARDPEMQSRMNLKIKFRESFRPFAPMVLVEDATQYFDVTQESPYMLLVYPVTAARRTGLGTSSDAVFPTRPREGSASITVANGELLGATVTESATWPCNGGTRSRHSHGHVADSVTVAPTKLTVTEAPTLSDPSDNSVSDTLETPVSGQPFGIELLKIPRSDIPAVTHVDYSARVQSIDPVRNPFIHGVLTRFKSLTGCSVIVNTSFNVRGEPIVNTAEDAYRCFMATEIDCLVVGNRFLTRTTQPHPPLDDAAREQWLKRFELD